MQRRWGGMGGLGWNGRLGVVWEAWGGVGGLGWYGRLGVVWEAWGGMGGLGWYGRLGVLWYNHMGMVCLLRRVFVTWDKKYRCGSLAMSESFAVGGIRRFATHAQQYTDVYKNMNCMLAYIPAEIEERII